MVHLYREIWFGHDPCQKITKSNTPKIIVNRRGYVVSGLTIRSDHRGIAICTLVIHPSPRARPKEYRPRRQRGFVGGVVARNHGSIHTTPVIHHKLKWYHQIIAIIIVMVFTVSLRMTECVKMSEGRMKLGCLMASAVVTRPGSANNDASFIRTSDSFIFRLTVNSKIGKFLST